MAKIGQYYMETQQNPIAAVRQQGVSDPNAFGANVGQAMGILGNAITNLGEVEFQEQLRQQEKRRKMNVMNAETNSENEITNILYGENGLMHLQGDNALPKVATKEAAAVPGVGQRVQQSLADIRKKYLDNLTDDDERMVFGKMFDDRARAYTRAAMLHEEKQGDIAFQQSREASRVSSANQFATLVASGNLEQAVITLQNGMGIYNNTGKTLGVPKDVLEQENKSWMNVTISNTIVAQAKAGNIELATQLRSRFGSDLDANTKAIVDGALKPIIDQNEILRYTETVRNDPKYYKNGQFDLESALADAYSLFGPKSEEVVVPVDDSKLKFSSGDNPDWNSVTPKTKYGVTQLWDGLSVIDSNVQITSGYRDPDRNRQAGGVPTSNHLSGNAVDIAFERELTPEEQDRIVAQAKAQGFQEVLWHDVGSGFHLHVGDYQGQEPSSTSKKVSAYDPVKLANVQNQLRAVDADFTRDRTHRINFETERVKNLLVNSPSIVDQLNIINTSSLPDYMKKDMSDKINSTVQSNINKSANGALEVLKASGGLTLSAVESMKEQLGFHDYISWIAKATSQQKTDAEKANDSADTQWHAWVKGELFPGEAAKQNEYILDLKSYLDNDGVNGGLRTIKAREYINNQKNNVGAILGYRARNSEGFAQLANIYDSPDKSVTALILKADPNADADGWNKILSQIGYMIREEKDEDAEYAYNLIVNNNLPFTEESFWQIRNEHRRLNYRL